MENNGKRERFSLKEMLTIERLVSEKALMLADANSRREEETAEEKAVYGLLNKIQLFLEDSEKRAMALEIKKMGE